MFRKFLFEKLHVDIQIVNLIKLIIRVIHYASIFLRKKAK